MGKNRCSGWRLSHSGFKLGRVSFFLENECDLLQALLAALALPFNQPQYRW